MIRVCSNESAILTIDIKVAMRTLFCSIVFTCTSVAGDTEISSESPNILALQTKNSINDYDQARSSNRLLIIKKSIYSFMTSTT